MGKATDRFLDIHLLSRDGWYDFGANIQSGQAYQSGKNGSELGPDHQILVTAPAGGGNATLLKAKTSPPERGFIAIGVRIDELEQNQVRNDEYAQLIEWVSDPSHKGKLRLNAHGAGAGHIYMHNSKINQGGARKVDDILIGHFPLWLQTHSLKQKPTKTHLWGLLQSNSPVRERGLVTICLALCHAANPDPIGLGKSALPDFSCVDLVSLLLRDRGFLGIEVTGGMTESSVALSEKDMRAQIGARFGNTTPPDGMDMNGYLDGMTKMALANYPAGTKPGQWLEKIPAGNGRYRRLAKTEFKLSKVS